MGYAKERRPRYEQLRDRSFNKIQVSTAASTALEPRGVRIIDSAATSSASSLVFTLLTAKAGDRLQIVARTVASSSVSPVHINCASGAFFSYSSASTGHDMVSLSSAGAAFTAIAYTSSEWLITGVRGATLSTST